MRIATAAASATVAVLAAAVLAGCSSSGSPAATTGGSSSSGPTKFPSTSAASSAPTSAPLDSTTAAASSSAAASGTLQPKLLAASDLKGFTQFSEPDTDSSLPCTPGVVLTKAYPPAQRARADFASATKLSAFSESLFGFTGDAPATAFVTAAEKGFNCSQGTLAGTPIKIVPFGKVTTSTPLDVAQRWDFATPDGTLFTAIIARAGNLVIGLTFEAKKAGASEIAPANILELAAAKAEK